MNKFQKMARRGDTILIERGRITEHHLFKSEEEAIGRFKIIEEAFTWIGTPFVDCGVIKGPTGAVDCAMLLRACYVDTGRLADFDPRPYPPRWHVHKDQELFIEWIERLGGVEVHQPQLGDIVVYQFGRCYSHGAILVNSKEIIHAYSAARCCLLTKLDEPLLTHKSTANKDIPRPIKYFNVWGN